MKIVHEKTTNRKKPSSITFSNHGKRLVTILYYPNEILILQALDEGGSRKLIHILSSVDVMECPYLGIRKN
jgi:hypothetical protein